MALDYFTHSKSSQRGLGYTIGSDTYKDIGQTNQCDLFINALFVQCAEAPCIFLAPEDQFPNNIWRKVLYRHIKLMIDGSRWGAGVCVGCCLRLLCLGNPQDDAVGNFHGVPSVVDKNY